MNKMIASGMAAALSMAIALPVFAEDSSSSSSNSSAMSSSSSEVSSSEIGRMMKAKEKANRTMSSKPAVDVTCVQPVVAKRENAVITAMDAYVASVKTALTTRRDALNTAWGLTDKTARETAIKAAHTAFKTSSKTAKTTLRAAQKSAWQTFKTEAKACKVSVPAAETSAETTDTQL